MTYNQLNMFLLQATFAVDWKHASRYPAMIIFWICICFCVNNMAWLAQFVPNARKDIICRRDGSLRRAEPRVR